MSKVLEVSSEVPQTVAGVLNAPTVCKDVMKVYRNLCNNGEGVRGNLSMSRILLLTFLKNIGNTPFAKHELASCLHLQNQSMSKAFMQLDKDGLIVQKKYEGNRRLFVVRLTEKGNALFK